MGISKIDLIYNWSQKMVFILLIEAVRKSELDICWYGPKISDVMRRPGKPHSGSPHHVHYIRGSINGIRGLKRRITPPLDIKRIQQQLLAGEMLMMFSFGHFQYWIHINSLYSQLIIVCPLTLICYDTLSQHWLLWSAQLYNWQSLWEGCSIEQWQPIISGLLKHWQC